MKGPQRGKADEYYASFSMEIMLISRRAAKYANDESSKKPSLICKSLLKRSSDWINIDERNLKIS